MQYYVCNGSHFSTWQNFRADLSEADQHVNGAVFPGKGPVNLTLLPSGHHAVRTCFSPHPHLTLRGERVFTELQELIFKIRTAVSCCTSRRTMQMPAEQGRVRTAQAGANPAAHRDSEGGGHQPGAHSTERLLQDVTHPPQ